MNKVDFPSLRPSICFMCEMVDAEFYIDTLREWDSGPLTNLTGRKYLCSNCVSTFASFCDWVPLEKVAALEREISELRAENEALAIKATAWTDLLSQVTVPEDKREEVKSAPAKRGRPRKVVKDGAES